MTEVKEELLRRIQSAPNRRLTAVEATRGLSWSRALAALEQLVDEGVLRRVKRGTNPNPDYALGERGDN